MFSCSFYTWMKISRSFVIIIIFYHRCCFKWTCWQPACIPACVECISRGSGIKPGHASLPNKYNSASTLLSIYSSYLFYFFYVSQFQLLKKKKEKWKTRWEFNNKQRAASRSLTRSEPAVFSFTSGLSGGKVTACWHWTPEMGVELRSTVGNSRVCKTKKERKRKEKEKESTETQRGANMRENGRSRCAKVSSFPPLCKTERLV